MAISKWRPRPKALTRRQASRTYARKQTDWVTAFNVECREICLTPGLECPNGAVIQLLTNQTLRDVYEGTLLVKRIRGELTFRPSQPTLPNPCDITAWTKDVVFRMGLMKNEGVQSQAFFPDGVNPLKAGLSVFPKFPAGDYSEQPWLRMWNHTWAPTGRLKNSQIPPTCCPVVLQPGYIVPPTVVGNNIGYIVPAITTECIPCDPSPETPCLLSFEVDVHPAWTTSVSYARGIRLTGGESLNLWIGWERIQRCTDPEERWDQPEMNVHGGIRLLLET